MRGDPKLLFESSCACRAVSDVHDVVHLEFNLRSECRHESGEVLIASVHTTRNNYTSGLLPASSVLCVNITKGRSLAEASWKLPVRSEGA